MSVLDRSTLVDSPLADLHALASELSIDGFRRLRRPDLITAILQKQGSPDAGSDADAAPEATASEDAASEAASEAPSEAVDSDAEEGSGTRRRRGRRGGRGRASGRDDAQTATDSGSEAEAEADDDSDAQDEPKPRRSRARGRGADARDTAAAQDTEARPARGRRETAPATEEPEAGAEEESTVEGTVELLANGSGFVRVAGPDPSDDDVYISSAQVKRCELVSGDAIAGPKRAPRRSERFASLIRVETINGRPASELADSVRFDDLPATLPNDRLKVGSEDPTLKAIEWLTPFGRGSRVTIVGASRSGKSEALKRLAAAFAGNDELTLSVALVGVRPEEISEWTRDAAGSEGSVTPTAAVSFAASEDAQSGALEPVVDQAKRLAARGAHAVVLIDTLDGLSPQSARKAISAARNIVDGGSVTVIATASAPVGGETTVIVLDAALTSVGRFPALDLLASGTLRPELLVGDAGAEAIARTRAEVSEDDED